MCPDNPRLKNFLKQIDTKYYVLMKIQNFIIYKRFLLNSFNKFYYIMLPEIVIFLLAYYRPLYYKNIV